MVAHRHGRTRGWLSLDPEEGAASPALPRLSMHAPRAAPAPHRARSVIWRPAVLQLGEGGVLPPLRLPSRFGGNKVGLQEGGRAAFPADLPAHLADDGELGTRDQKQ